MSEFLKVVLATETEQFEASLKGAEKQLFHFARKAGEAADRVMKAVSLPLAALGGQAIRTAMEFEKLETSLVALTGSTKAGADEFQRLQTFSARTPFQLKDLLKATQTMMGFSLSSEEAFSSLKMIADIAAITGGNMQGISLAFGQTAATGKLMGDNLMQLIDNGVPVIQMLADSMGVAEGEIKKLASESKISFDALVKAFRDATEQGGKFYKGAERQSQTLSGAFSTLRDNFDIFLGRAGEVITKNLELNENFQRLTRFLREATDSQIEFIVQMGQWAVVTPVVVKAISTIITSFSRLKKAMEGVQKVISKNPWIAAAIAATVVGYEVYTATNRLDNFNDEVRDLADTKFSIETDFEDFFYNIDLAISDAEKLKMIVAENLERSGSAMTGNIFGALHPDMIQGAVTGLGVQGVIDGADALEKLRLQAIEWQKLGELNMQFKSTAKDDVEGFKELVQNAFKLANATQEMYPDLSKAARTFGKQMIAQLNAAQVVAENIAISAMPIRELLEARGIPFPSVEFTPEQAGPYPAAQSMLDAYLAVEEELKIIDENVSKIHEAAREPLVLKPMIELGSLADIERHIAFLRSKMVILGPENIEQAKQYQEQIAALEERYKKLQEQLGITNEGLEDQSGAMILLTSIAKSFGEILSNAFANAIINADNFADSLKNIGKLLASSALQFAIKAFLTGGLTGAKGFLGDKGGLFGFLGGLFSAPTEAVGDALITDAGKVVKFHPKDNILAMKDLSNLGKSLQPSYSPNVFVKPFNSNGQLNRLQVDVTGKIRGDTIYISGTRGGERYNR